MYRDCVSSVVAEDITPNVVIEMINGDIARFVFPVYNEKDNGELDPVNLKKTDATYKFKAFLSDTLDGAITCVCAIDGGKDNNVQNGIRFNVASRIETDDLEKHEWPITVSFNIIGYTTDTYGKNSDEDSFVHGDIVISKAPYKKPLE